MPRPTTPFDGIAWVTGASTGIGKATAIALARKGWRVAVTARSAEKLNEMAALSTDLYGEIVVMPGDVTNEAQMADIVATLEKDHGGVALAILNAGIYQPIYGNQLTLEVFKKTTSVNLDGTLTCLVPLSKAMGKRGRGQIALVSSVAGYGGLPTSAAYGATKAALINMAESLKYDFDKMGIHIQVVNPGFVDTPATQKNPFEMPFLMDVEKAAERLLKGLDTKAFEITFPKRFTYLLKFMNLLPYSLYFPFMTKMMKWDKQPLPENADEGDDEAEMPEQHRAKRW